MSLKELCSKLGGTFRKRKYDEEEFDVCRIPIEGETHFQKRAKIYEVFQEIAKFAESELGLTNHSLDTSIVLSKTKADHSANIQGVLTITDPKDITAIEVELNPKKKIYYITPITKRGRGCTLFFTEFDIGGYCDKNKTELYLEGNVIF